MDNGEMLIINIPPLTEERRIELVKRSKQRQRIVEYLSEVPGKMLTMRLKVLVKMDFLVRLKMLKMQFKSS